MKTHNISSVNREFVENPQEQHFLDKLQSILQGFLISSDAYGVVIPHEIVEYLKYIFSSKSESHSQRFQYYQACQAIKVLREIDKNVKVHFSNPPTHPIHQANIHQDL